MTSVNPFDCVQCGEKCKTNGGMKRHMKATGHCQFLIPMDKLELDPMYASRFEGKEDNG